MKRMLAVLLFPCLALATPAAAGEPGDPPSWAEVNGILAKHCVMCHSAQGAGLGLRLDSYGAAIAGSTNGKVLVPGDPEHSELIRRLRGLSAPRMPFLGRPLPDADIELIIRWVENGMPEH